MALGRWREQRPGFHRTRGWRGAVGFRVLLAARGVGLASLLAALSCRGSSERRCQAVARPSRSCCQSHPVGCESSGQRRCFHPGARGRGVARRADSGGRRARVGTRRDGRLLHIPPINIFVLLIFAFGWLPVDTKVRQISYYDGTSARQGGTTMITLGASTEQFKNLEYFSLT